MNEESLLEFLDESLRAVGTSACPPYHLALVVGGTSAEFNLKTAKLASAHYLDTLPTSGSADTGHGYRDIEWEAKVSGADSRVRYRRSIRRKVLLS